MEGMAVIDPVNRGLLSLTQSGILTKLIKRVLDGRGCPSCGPSRARVAVEWMLGSRGGICDDCRRYAKELEDAAGPVRVDPFARRALLNALKGVAAFGVRRPFVAGAPRLVTWELTSRCNTGRCAHCYTDSGPSGKKDELSTVEALAAVEDFAGAGVLGIAFTGGEAMLREDFFEIAGHAVSRGIACYVATNGTPLTEENVLRLKDVGVSLVHVSLDSPDPEFHDAFRGVAGLHRAAVEGMRRCVAAGLQVCIAATAMRANWERLPELVDLADGLGVDWVLVYNYVPTGRGTALLDPTPEQREKLFVRLWERARNTRRTRVSVFAPQFGVMALKAGGRELLATHYLEPLVGAECQGLVRASAGCMAGKYYLAMAPNGDVKPCTFLLLRLGNVRESGVDEIWMNNRVLAQLRDPQAIRGHCRYCRFRWECGGCRARAYACTGDYLGSDPGCAEANAATVPIKVRGRAAASV